MVYPASPLLNSGLVQDSIQVWCESVSKVSRCLFISGLWFATAAFAQDTSTGAIRGTVGDASGARIGASSVVLVNAATNFRYSTTTGFQRQRQRFVLSCVVAPRLFHRDHEWLGICFNNWKASGVVTVGSRRPVSATATGDADQDGNNSNDRLPGVSRDSLLGPDYATTESSHSTC